MARKTIEVNTLREWVNTRLAIAGSSHYLPEGMTPEEAFRLGAASLLEQVLHASGNYRGFRYTDTEAGDETRRHYY